MPPLGLSVRDASVLVTGASSGIGASLAESLAARGARAVGIVGRRVDRLEAVAERCRAAGAECVTWVQDLGDVDAAEHLITDAWGRLDGLDVLVNNAAAPMRRAVRQLTTSELQDTMRIDFESPARMALTVLPRMLERDRGIIVNVSSLGGRLGIAHETAYCAAKFALCGFSEAMAIDLWDTGVSVRLVIPGPIDTDIWDRPGSDAPLYDGPKEPPSLVADGIIAAIEGARFEHYLPDMKSIAEFKTSEIDVFLEGSAAMAHPTDGGAA